VFLLVRLDQRGNDSLVVGSVHVNNRLVISEWHVTNNTLYKIEKATANRTSAFFQKAFFFISKTGKGMLSTWILEINWTSYNREYVI